MKKEALFQMCGWRFIFLFIFYQTSISMERPVHPFFLIPTVLHTKILLEVAKRDYESNAHTLLLARKTCKDMKSIIDTRSVDLINALKQIVILKPLFYQEKEEWATIKAALCIGTVPAIGYLKEYLSNSSSCMVSAKRLFGCCFDDLRTNDVYKVFTLKKLIDAGIPVDTELMMGETSIMRAVRRGNIALVKLFLAKNCNLLLKNAEGQSIKDIIKESIQRAQRKKEDQKVENLKQIKALLKSAVKGTIKK